MNLITLNRRLLVTVHALLWAGASNASFVPASLIPSYAGSENTVSIEWQNISGDPTIATDWQLTSFEHRGPFPLTNFDNGNGPGVPTVGISAGSVTYNFYIPNVVDDLPFKRMRTYESYEIFGSGVEFRDVISPSGGVNFLGFSVFDNSFAGILGVLVVSDWLIAPNPDFEFFSVHVFGAARLVGVAQSSQSFGGVAPEPSSLSLALLGLFASVLLSKKMKPNALLSNPNCVQGHEALNYT